MKRYRPYNAGQGFLLPPSPATWLPEGHLAYFLLDVVQQLDLSEISRAIDAKDPRGERPYSPWMMTALLLYAYCVGVFSSRRIERATYEDVAFRVITSDQHPDATRISEFRRRHLDALAGLFVQTVRLCQQAGLVKLGVVAIDGTKVQANASKHKAMSYERMKKNEDRLHKEIASLLQRAEDVDAAEDALYGAGTGVMDDVPVELRRREDRLARLREAKQALEREAAATRKAEHEALAARQEQAAASAGDATERKRAASRARKHLERAAELGKRHDDDDPPSSGGATTQRLRTHRVAAKPDGTPHEKAQYNFTDPDSRVQRRGGEYLQGYNCQAVVDGHAQVIVSQGVTNQPPDNHHLPPLLQQVRATCGAMPAVALADAGYWEPGHDAYAQQCGIELYIATQRSKHSTPSAPIDGAAADCDDPRGRMQAKLQTEAGRAVYGRRKTIVEPVFGQIKEARGFRRFHLRGLRKVMAEWSFVAATHNLLKLYRCGKPVLA